MTARDRYLATLLFGSPDRIPLDPGRGRESTLARWHREGLPESVVGADVTEYAYRQAGGVLPWPESGPSFPVMTQMIPEFEKKVLERLENSQIVQDWKGNICEIGLEYTVNHLGGTNGRGDFVTRRWIKCPVESRADWDGMKGRYDASSPGRMPADAAALGARLKDRAYPVVLHISGPYWQLREWCGFEGLSMMFYDDPGLVRDMLDFWRDHILEMMKRMFAHCVPDEVWISEDMAYKGYSMVSPAMTRDFLLPVWKAWGEAVRAAGVPIYAVDSDGFIGELIPIWMEAGVNACDPIEVAAGNDIVAFRKRFGKNMAYRGGVDKREIARGGRRIEAEMDRILPVIRDGGYIPGCDHGVPHDVSWPDYVSFVKRLSRDTGWL